MQGHWGCARYIYIGSAADEVFTIIKQSNILLIITLTFFNRKLL
jgi:hypothetical protein